MAFQSLPVAFALVLVVLTFRHANGDVYFVATNVTYCNVSTSCNTLNYYASSTTQQLTDSVFYFMPGTHLLQQVWVIENANNLTLTGRSPNSTEDDEVIILCTNRSTDRGIQVIKGRNIALEYMGIFHCRQGADGANIPSSALLCDSTDNLEISNITMGYSRDSCLKLINCTDYAVTDSVFAYSGAAVFIQGLSSGNLTSIELINNAYGVVAYDHTPNLVTILLDRINAYDTHQLTFYFHLCSANISLTQSLSVHSGTGGFVANQACSFSQKYLFQIQNCNFTGGFVIIVSQAQEVLVKIRSCVFSNTAENPSYPGIAIKHIPFSIEKQGTMTQYLIEDVTMEDINVPGNPNPVMHLSSIELVSITNLSILNNGHGGLVLDDSVAVFRGTNTFSNNSGNNGGGMALYGNSYVFFADSTTTMEFTNNKAQKFGGGIFVSQDETWTDAYCFMQLDDQQPNISFQDNIAGYAGSHLYGGSIETCRQAQSELNLTDVLGFSKNATQCSKPNVSSDAMKLTLCDDDCIETTETVATVPTYPGTKLNLNIAAIGQLSGLTQATILLTYGEVFDHDKEDESQYINATCTHISRDIRAKRTDTTGKINFTLSDEFISPSINTPVTVTVELLPCPPGFNFSKQTCVCSNSIQTYAECDIKTKNITRNVTSWIFPTNQSIMFFEHCPFDYCNTEPFSVDNPDGQCDHSRSGMLCGDCIQGYSLTLGSSTCLNCTHQLWQLPVILLGSALAGVGLVAVLIVLNLTVSVGTINGFLFFVNVVKIYESVLFKNLHPFWKYLFAWLNLDLGITTCFYEGMNACQKVGLQFVFPMYLLLLVMAIVAVCRCGQWIGLRSLPWVVKFSDKTSLLMGSKIIPVLATLLLFSYTKLIRTIILIYHKADIHIFDCGTNTSDCGNQLSWYVKGSVKYLTHCHKVLFSVGTVIIVPLVSLFTAFLLFFPLMERYLPRFNFWSSWHMRLKPWYDAYGGPYKDEYRFWTGLLLLVRCLLVIVVTIQDYSNEVSLSVLMWLCLILIPMVALLQVYKSSILNVLEIIYLSSILAMVFLSMCENNVQLYLVLSLSLCLLVAILIYHTYLRVKATQFALFLRKSITRMRKIPSPNEQDWIDSKDDDSICRNVSVSTIDFPDSNELREPLLYDSSCMTVNL